MIYPKSPDKAIEMQVPGYAIILYDPPYVYTTNQGKKFLINGEEYTVTTNYKGNIYKLFSMLQKEDTVKIKYFWIGGGKCIGFIFQDFRLFPEYTVRDNILIPFYLDHRAPDEQMLHKLTGILGIAGKLHSRPAQLSGGQQQRVAIARALIAKPRIVFADEPTGNLDTRTGEDTMRLLMECAAEFGQTLIVVTHNPEIAQKAQQVIRIEDGQILRGELQHEKGNLDTQ